MTEGWCEYTKEPKLERWCVECMGPVPYFAPRETDIPEYGGEKMIEEKDLPMDCACGVRDQCERCNIDYARSAAQKSVVVPQYKDMTREELIEALEAHDAHHQEHHENMDAWASHLRKYGKCIACDVVATGIEEANKGN